MKTLYKTDRLILKVLDENYAHLVLDYILRNKDFLKEWEIERSDNYYTLPYQRMSLKRDIQNFKLEKALRFWIFKKEDKDRIIGSIAIDNIIRGPFQSGFLGYKLDKDELNKGYMTEATKKIIEIAFNGYGLHRIEGNIMPRNIASIKVVEKLGFYNEGLAKKYLLLNGKWEDHIHMVLLNEK
ncbi:MAG: GNAT family N-acetyltransferase [Gudongella sp.]|nr:GNAT family N-acetyltransferase [Gudongella sp.]